VTTSAIRRRYGHGAARRCRVARQVRWEVSPSLLPNATSGAATVLIGGLTVFALLRAIQPPEEPPSEIQIVELRDVPPPEPPPPAPEPEQVLQPLPEPPPPEPEPKPEPVVVAKAEPPPKPPPVVHKAEPPKHREPPPKPKPVIPPPVAPEPVPMWKQAPIAPPPRTEAPPVQPPPPARRPPPVQIDAPKPAPVVAEASQPDTRTQWKPVALAEKPAARPSAPKVSIDAVTAPSAPAPAAPPARVASLPPGVPGPKQAAPVPIVRPVLAAPAAPAPDNVADVAPSSTLARSSVPSPSAPVVARRPPPTKGLAMPGISADRANSPAAASATDTRDYSRPGVTAPPTQAARAEPNQKLRGVPLGSLAACRTDRLEDDLKQQVLGAVGNREECASSAGHYFFVETKNLNAFLMWIERAPGRAEGDRCAELSFALSCLRRSGGAR